MRDVIDPRDFRVWVTIDPLTNLVLSSHMFVAQVENPGPNMIDITNRLPKAITVLQGDDLHTLADPVELAAAIAEAVAAGSVTTGDGTKKVV